MENSDRTVLVVADVHPDVDLYQHLLQRNAGVSYRVLTEIDEGQIFKQCQLHGVDAVLLEFDNPNSRGLELLEQLRVQLGDRCPPMIVVGNSDIDRAKRAFKAGAADYLVKDHLTSDHLHQSLQAVMPALDGYGSAAATVPLDRQALEASLRKCQAELAAERQAIQQLSDMSSRLIQGGDPSPLYGQILDLAIALMHADTASLQRFDPERNKLYLLSWRGFEPEAAAFWEWVWVDSGSSCGMALKAGERVIVPDIETCDHIRSTPDYDFLRLCRIRSVQMMPLRSRSGHLVGMISTQWQVPHEPSLEELARLEVLARQAADLLEQQQVQKSLQQSSELLAIAMEAANAGWGSWNWLTGEAEWSDGGRRIMGFTRDADAATIAGWLNQIHPEDRPRVEAHAAEVARGRCNFDMDFRIIHPNGDIRWLRGAGRMIYDSSGRPVRSTGFVFDLTERKHREANAAFLAEIATDLSRLSSADEILHTVGAKMGEYLNLSVCSFVETNGAIEEAVIHYAWHRTDVINVIGAYRISDFVTEEFLQAAQNREAIIVRDVSADPRTDTEKYAALKIGSFISVPFHKDGQWKFLLNVYDSVPHDWRADEVDLIRELAEQVFPRLDRVRAEDARRESEEQSRQILESISDGFCALDEDWRFIYVNRAAEQILDLAPNDLIGKVMWDEFPGLHGSEFERIYRDAMGDRQPGSVVAFYPDHNRWYTAHAYPAPQGITIYFQNVTAQVEAEAALRQSEERLRLATEAAQMGTWDLDLTAGTVVWSDNHFPLLGYDPVPGGETSYKMWLERVHPDDRKRVVQAWQQAKRNHQLYRAEYRVIRADNGGIAWLAALGSFTYDEAGQAVRSLGVVFDITPRKQAEVEREHLLKRERAAREEAESANRVKDEFLAILSHELRSPLNPILGWSRLLQTQKLDDAKVSLALSTIERNARLQTQLINDLLDVAKILRGKLELTETRVSLISVIESALEVVRTAAEAKSISLQARVLENGLVRGDEARLQQVVWNLLSNAIKFSPMGGRVGVCLELVNGYARVTVSDTGKGISPEFLPRLFEAFHQEDASITRKYGGLGLGLSIAKYLIEAHGGTIAADSPGEGLGATFTVDLPLLSEEPLVLPDGLPPRTDVDLTGLKVLAVDDQADARELLAMMLTQYGAEARVVASGSEVLTLLSRFKPDALVCDIGMPGMDGYTLMQQIRSLPPEQGGQVLAIALTAFAREDDAQRALDSGYQRHLPKPIEPDRLAIAIAELVQPHPRT